MHSYCRDLAGEGMGCWSKHGKVGMVGSCVSFHVLFSKATSQKSASLSVWAHMWDKSGIEQVGLSDSPGLVGADEVMFPCLAGGAEHRHVIIPNPI